MSGERRLPDVLTDADVEAARAAAARERSVHWLDRWVEQGERLEEWMPYLEDVVREMPPARRRAYAETLRANGERNARLLDAATGGQTTLEVVE